MSGAAPASGAAALVTPTFGAAREIARDIKLTHSVFALPFAALGAVYAVTRTAHPDWAAFALDGALVLACMVCARTAAMLANRLVDRQLDAANPRTQSRAIPAGRLSVFAAVVAYAVAGIAFVGCAALFGALHQNWWPLALAVPVLLWISVYGLLKRFTMMCHLWLGASLALSPPAAALAVDPQSLTEAAPWLMAAMVLCWVAGFDIIYALQDVEVDRRDGLHSIPSKLGVTRALWCARALHLAAFLFLVSLWQDVPEFGLLFGCAVALVGALLLVEHATVHKWGKLRIAATFTTVNGAVSLVVGGVGVASLVWAATMTADVG